MDIPRSRYLRRTTCVKCSNNGHVVLNGKDVYCASCFDDYCAHKFRSAFGRNKIFKGRSERVLVAVSGGPTSAGMLLDLVRRSCSADAHKKLQIQPEILHIVESPYVDDNNENSYTASLKRYIGDLPSHFIALGSIFDDDPAACVFSTRLVDADDGSSRDVSLKDTISSFCGRNVVKVTKLFESFSNDTSRLDFYRRLKTQLLVLCARKLGIHYVIVGDTCTSLSSRILSSTTQGRGGQIPDDVNVLDSRWSTTGDKFSDGVRIVRPLREFQNKEVAYYNHFRHLYAAAAEAAFIMRKPSFLPNSQSTSLQSASDDFVDSLQSQFPATVTTLFASASKLTPSLPRDYSTTTVTNSRIERRCRLCASTLDFKIGGGTNFLEGFCGGCSLALSDLADRKLLPPCLYCVP